MARDLDEDTKAAALADVKNIAILMEADFDSAPVRYFSGYGQLVVDGVTYIGSGKILQVDPAQETTDIQATSATIRLSGVQEADIAVALQEPYHGRPCRLKLAFLDASFAPIGSAVQVFGGRMDVMNLADDPAAPVITMTAENDLIRMSVARNRTRTHEDQQIDYPGDRGLEFVPTMQNKTVFV